MATKPKNQRPNRKKKPKQPYLGDMAPPSIPEIDDAANELQEVRSSRMALTTRETDLADSLLLLMHKHKLKVYEYEGKTVSIESLEKVKVKKPKSESNGEAEE